MKLIDFCVVTICCLCVALGFYGSFGCTAKTFDVSGDPAYESETDGSTGDSGNPSAEAGEDVPSSDAAKVDAESDSGRIPGDAPVEEARADTVVPDAISDGVKEETPSTFDHVTATGETYVSALPKGVYSVALFAETISKIKEKRPGFWSGPYDAVCDLSSEGHGKSETCKMISTSTMGVMICPFGISYVAAAASCPPLASPVSWW